MTMNTKIQYYLQKYNSESQAYNFISKASGETTLGAILDSIKNPKPELKKAIDDIRNEKDKVRRSELKSHLPGFIIQTYGTGLRRDYNNIVSFTGYTVLDFDGEKVKSYAKELKHHLFEAYPFIVASYISPSGKVKCIMKIGVAESIEEYKDYYRAIDQLFSQYVGFDKTPINAVLIMFYTYDKDILIREDATVFSDKVKEKPIKRPIHDVAPAAVLENTYLNTKRVYRYVETILDNIMDNGHPQLRRASSVLGGFAQYYNLSLSEAESWIHNKIQNHSYLNKGIRGYQKTASEFISLGASNPRELPNLKT